MVLTHRARAEAAGDRGRYSVVVPVYKNEPTLRPLRRRLDRAGRASWTAPLEVVFVVDGSPDGSLFVLRRLLAEERASRRS